MIALTTRPGYPGMFALVADGQRFEFRREWGPLLADMLDSEFPECEHCEDRSCIRCEDCHEPGCSGCGCPERCVTCGLDEDDEDCTCFEDREDDEDGDL